MIHLHRVLTLIQCEWILYESCHKFFMKATQIFMHFVLLNIGWENQTVVSESFEPGKYYIYIFFYFERLEFMLC